MSCENYTTKNGCNLKYNQKTLHKDNNIKDFGNVSVLVYNQEFQQSVIDQIQLGHDFRHMLNEVCEVVTSRLVMTHIDEIGTTSIENLRERSNKFQLACHDIIDQYTGDLFCFRYVFLDIWIMVTCYADIGDKTDTKY